MRSCGDPIRSRATGTPRRATYDLGIVSTGDEGSSDHDDEIRLGVPAIGSYGRVARLAVVGLASRSGFSYDEVEDLRIAVGEIFGLLVQPEDADVRLVFSCRLRPDALDLTATREPPGAIPQISDLSSQILHAVADEVDVDLGAATIRIVKALVG